MAEAPELPPLPMTMWVKWGHSRWHVAPPWLKITASAAESTPVTPERTFLQCGSDAPPVSVVEDRMPPLKEICKHCQKRLAKKHDDKKEEAE